ncbi:hypothetical protein [Alteromonas sp. 14N.309.X.WAT.G.H12]|uniref:hypothetical protein n=1 Tax=Alteromonas sp. 14N.309.X.WAT.G.H12 TaxID=3120824 RepID=UPI002FD154CB
MTTYTVFAFYDETGQSAAFHVEARNPSHAFFVAAKENTQATFLSAVKGALFEGEDVGFTGGSVVDASTILEQSEVFDI